MGFWFLSCRAVCVVYGVKMGHSSTEYERLPRAEISRCRVHKRDNIFRIHQMAACYETITMLGTGQEEGEYGCSACVFFFSFLTISIAVRILSFAFAFIFFHNVYYLREEFFLRQPEHTEWGGGLYIHQNPCLSFLVFFFHFSHERNQVRREREREREVVGSKTAIYTATF